MNEVNCSLQENAPPVPRRKIGQIKIGQKSGRKGFVATEFALSLVTNLGLKLFSDILNFINGYNFDFLTVNNILHF